MGVDAWGAGAVVLAAADPGKAAQGRFHGFAATVVAHPTSQKMLHGMQKRHGKNVRGDDLLECMMSTHPPPLGPAPAAAAPGH